MEKYNSEEEEDEEYDYEKDNDYENVNKLPEIKQRKKENEKEENTYNIKKVYTNSYNPLKKYRLKQKEGEKIVNTIMKHNPKLEQLLYNHEIYKMKLDGIRSHIK